MKFTEAFTSLGYELQAPRQDWSAEAEKGVCISIWEAEIKPRNKLPWMDTKVHAGPLSVWQHKPGNTKRKKHLSRVMQELQGAVDVVIVHGDPIGGRYVNASPWFSSERHGSWHISDFDLETGHFVAEVRPMKITA